MYEHCETGTKLEQEQEQVMMFPPQVTMVCGISTPPSPGSAGTSERSEETPTTSPSSANQPEPPASATRSEVTTTY